jgi:hypothetical protein
LALRASSRSGWTAPINPVCARHEQSLSDAVA